MEMHPHYSATFAYFSQNASFLEIGANYRLQLMRIRKQWSHKVSTHPDLDWLKAAIIRKTGGKDGMLQTGVEGICFHYHSRDEVLVPHFLEPVIILVIQGTKLVQAGERKFSCPPGSCVVSAVNMPISSCAKTSSGLYLSISLPLNFSIISGLLNKAEKRPVPDAVRGIGSEYADAELLEAFIRLVKSLDMQKYGNRLTEIISEEIHLRLLMGTLADTIMCMFDTEAYGSHIREAVGWLEQHYREAICINELPPLCCMSKSTFYRCFRNVTTVSPLQYLKRLRLEEARRLMLASQISAKMAAQAVGYHSVSQFNREYKRLFGISPARDSWQSD